MNRRLPQGAGLLPRRRDRQAAFLDREIARRQATALHLLECSGRGTLGFIVLLAALLLAGGAGLFSQRQETVLLHTQLELTRTEVAELGSLRAENRQLRGKQPSPEALETLRADHAALPRLRAELEALEKAAAATQRP